MNIPRKIIPHKTNFINVFNVAREVPLTDVISAYAGIKLAQRGSRWSGCCPLHDDRSPSFIVYPDGRFHCFGCGISGDSISLVGQLFNLTPLESARKIAQDFGLQTNSEPLSVEAKQRVFQVARDRQKAREFELWANRSYKRLALLCRQINTFIVTEAEITDEMAILANQLPLITFCLDILAFSKNTDKVELFRSGLIGRWGL